MKNKQTTTSKSIIARSRVALALLIACLVGLIARLVNLQLKDSEDLKGRAVNQYTYEITLEADRGNIYDRNMKQLARSSTVQTIFISPRDIENDAQAELIATNLSEILGVDKEAIIEKTKKTKSAYQIIKKKVEEKEELAVRDFVERNNLHRQVCFEEGTKRYYPYSMLASQVIGFTGTDNTGLSNNINKVFFHLNSPLNYFILIWRPSCNTHLLLRQNDLADVKPSPVGPAIVNVVYPIPPTPIPA